MISPTDDLDEVLGKSVQWDVHSSARLISDDDLQRILRFDKRDADTQRNLLAEVSRRARVCCEGRERIDVTHTHRQT